MNSTVDAFGHKQLGGVAMYLGELIKAKLGISFRAIELSTVQRSASMIRSETDVNEAITTGKKAVEFALSGEHAKMVGLIREDGSKYKIKYLPVDVYKVANKEQVIPLSMIDKENNKMTQEFYDYIYPLIEGEYKQEYRNGVQKFFLLK
jgi:6-phosphofructokinase